MTRPVRGTIRRGPGSQVVSFARSLATTRILPQRLATAILTVFVVLYGALAIQGVVVNTSSVGQGLLSSLFVVVLIALQLGYISRPSARLRSPWKYAALLLYAVLVFVPLVLFGPAWRGFPGMLAGNALLLLPVQAAIPVFVLIVAALVLFGFAGNDLVGAGESVIAGTYTLTSTVTAGLALYALSTLVRLVVEAQEAREELRRSVVAQERVRFARKLHDLLGESLSAIALRGQLVARLMDEHSERARTELADVLVLARKALADVRLVADVRRELGSRKPSTAQSAVPAVALRPRLGLAMLLIVLADFGVNAVIGVAEDRGALPAIVTAFVRISQAVLVVHLTQARNELTPARRNLELLALAALIWVPIGYIGPYGLGTEPILMGVGLVVLPPVAGIACYVIGLIGAVAADLLSKVQIDSLPADLSYLIVGSVLVSAVYYGLATVTRLVSEVRAARGDVSVVAAAQERVRFARDVHDLLGFSLSAVALKAELVGKLIGRQPERANAELDELLDTTHRALTDVRSVASGEHVLSLAAECELVESTLEAADVRVTLTRDASVPEGPASTLLATVLREAGTNVLRHSKAEWCTVVIARLGDQLTLEVANDGVGAGRVGDDVGGGSGLGNMTERLAVVGGLLTTEITDDEHRLWVRVPLAAEAPGQELDGQERTRRLARAG